MGIGLLKVSFRRSRIEVKVYAPVLDKKLQIYLWLLYLTQLSPALYEQPVGKNALNPLVPALACHGDGATSARSVLNDVFVTVAY